MNVLLGSFLKTEIQRKKLFSTSSSVGKTYTYLSEPLLTLPLVFQSLKTMFECVPVAHDSSRVGLGGDWGYLLNFWFPLPPVTGEEGL